MANPAELAYLSYLASEEETRQKNVVLAREYYDGEQHTELTERQKEFLGHVDGGRFSVNYCRSIVSAVVERLYVAGFESSTSKELSDWAWKTWQANRMDAHQTEVHEAGVRDGETFVFVSWDDEKKLNTFSLHPRYTDPQVGGTGFGCKIHYEQEDDPTTPALYATKRWVETLKEDGGGRRTRQRMNVYYPDKIEKYVMGGSGEATWVEYREEGEPWPVPRTTKSRQPIGIPIVPFFNPNRRTEIWDAIPIQDAINKVALDLIAAADATGFPIRFTHGFYFTTDGNEPASDGSNYVKLTPGANIYVPEEGSITDSEIPDLKPLLEDLDNWVIRLGQVTDTPLSRFQFTKQIAAEGTLKQQEAPLLAKIQMRQTRFGNAWEDCFKVAARLANTYGGKALDEEALLSTVWEPAEIRDEKEHIETIALKVEKLRITQEQAWQEAGYDQETIREMMKSPEYQARLQMQASAARMFDSDGEADGS